MKKNVLAPSVGESISEVSILKWNKKSGEAVKNGELILEIESDKATVEIVAEHSGVLTILKPQGERVPVGDVIGVIDSDGVPSVTASTSQNTSQNTSLSSAKAPSPSATPAPITTSGGFVQRDLQQMAADSRKPISHTPTSVILQAPTPAAPKLPPYQDQPGDTRAPLSMLRQKIAERLVLAQHTAAILTTFNEVDMSVVMKVRNEHKEAFEKKHGVKLSFMSFFARACVEALRKHPEVNAVIDGKDMITRDYQDLGIAVGTERGLVVPVIRGVGQGSKTMSLVEIEKAIAAMAVKARNNKLSLADLSGGTFTISNGGTYGSLMSTPILNPPQSGILGMHKIQERPMAINGKVEIRPMMYLALSYDHRVIDGKGAVTFLITIKDFLENEKGILNELT